MEILEPESLDYTSVFDDIFARYLTRCELVQVKTTNMGSLFKLEYRIVFREEGEEKNMIDQLRRRNGNLEILCSRAQTGRRNYNESKQKEKNRKKRPAQSSACFLHHRWPSADAAQQ